MLLPRPRIGSRVRTEKMRRNEMRTEKMRRNEISVLAAYCTVLLMDQYCSKLENMNSNTISSFTSRFQQLLFVGEGGTNGER